MIDIHGRDWLLSQNNYVWNVVDRVYMTWAKKMKQNFDAGIDANTNININADDNANTDVDTNTMDSIPVLNFIEPW